MSRSIKDMTKQKQIEEIANDIAKCCPNKVDDWCFDKNMNCVSCIAMELYNAGYRKCEEVRKETAKEFAEKVKAKAVQEAEVEDYVCYIVDRVLKEYEK